ncbi:preprotein translocase subunit SecY [bacterium]|nr:preprotein translocase subunit SecY [bacterium]
MNYIKKLFGIPDLRDRVLFTLLIVAIYRIGSHIPAPGIDVERLQSVFNANSLLGFFNLFSGGGLSRFSIFALGILPYINASIIMQLMTVVSPQIKELTEEGEAGRKQVGQYTRYLAVGLSFIQATVMTLGFRQFVLPGTDLTWFVVFAVIALVSGSSLVMWLGEVATEKGIGNGASLLIFIGIIAGLPLYVQNTYVLISSGTSWLNVVAFSAIFVGMVMLIVTIQEAQRRILVQYPKKSLSRTVVGAKDSYIPFRLIQGGVMPIIFASAVLQFPLFVAQFLGPRVNEILSVWYHYDGLIYNLLFCLMIFFFGYFYTAITFNPQDISDNIYKYGGIVSGVRPGTETVTYLDSVISKLTLFGGVCLSLIAVVPILSANLTKVTSFTGLGGTAILIIVGVALDLLKQIDAFIANKKYEGTL